MSIAINVHLIALFFLLIANVSVPCVLVVVLPFLGWHRLKKRILWKESGIHHNTRSHLTFQAWKKCYILAGMDFYTHSPQLNLYLRTTTYFNTYNFLILWKTVKATETSYSVRKMPNSDGVMKLLQKWWKIGEQNGYVQISKYCRWNSLKNRYELCPNPKVKAV